MLIRKTIIALSRGLESLGFPKPNLDSTIYDHKQKNEDARRSRWGVAVGKNTIPNEGGCKHIPRCTCGL